MSPKTLLLAIALLAAGALAPAAARQDEPPEPTVRCTKCKHVGRLPCGEHPEDECAFEDEVLFCSVVADCATCGGTGWVDCPKCENPEVEAALKRRREQSAAAAKRVAWVDETWNDGRERKDVLRKVETEHFVLVWEMEGLKIDKRRCSEHETMHVYAARLERLFADWLSTFGARAAEFSKKSVVLVWQLPNDQMEASLRFCNNASPRGVKLLGSMPRFSVCANKQNFSDDEELHRSLVHNVAHLLLSHQRPSMWIGDKKYGWADEGVSHWFEDLYWQKCTNYCYQEANTNVDFKGGRFRVAVRKMVAMDKQPSIGEVFSRTTNDLTLPEHAVAFSYVDYLIHLDGKKFDALMKRLRAKEETRDALQRVYELNPLQFEEQWKAWVLETYPTR
ncbi:MAG: hypothetical protein H6828_01280 [Planctomycetes bacterium]|nr:hypothetical protein [Planctomycetota bacterium]